MTTRPHNHQLALLASSLQRRHIITSCSIYSTRRRRRRRFLWRLNVRYFADRCRVVVVYNVAFKTGNTMKHTTTTAHSRRPARQHRHPRSASCFARRQRKMLNQLIFYSCNDVRRQIVLTARSSACNSTITTLITS